MKNLILLIITEVIMLRTYGEKVWIETWWKISSTKRSYKWRIFEAKYLTLKDRHVEIVCLLWLFYFQFLKGIWNVYIRCIYIINLGSHSSHGINHRQGNVRQLYPLSFFRLLSNAIHGLDVYHESIDFPLCYWSRGLHKGFRVMSEFDYFFP